MNIPFYNCDKLNNAVFVYILHMLHFALIDPSAYNHIKKKTQEEVNLPVTQMCATPRSQHGDETPLAMPLPDTPRTCNVPENTKNVSSRRTLDLVDTGVTEAQRQRLALEIQKFMILSNTIDSEKIDYCDLESVINAVTFHNLCETVKIHCPLLTEILEIFVHSKEERKIKTGAEKLLRAIHAHSCLLQLTSQRSSSFPLFFAVLMLSFGCGDGKYSDR